ncbi:MAG TPA: hypothetical protein V6C78_21200 [Crinalium sp.]|jgi:Tfp pilus assembly protein PilF
MDAQSIGNSYYKRAQNYILQEDWSNATLELRDGIVVCPKRSDFHVLLGHVYLKRKLPTMAKIHFRQALKLNPQDDTALQYLAKIGA